MEKSQEEQKRPSALDMLRKQADTQPVRESAEAARVRMTAELDQALRGIDKYLAEVVGHVNSLTPVVDAAYELLFIGRIPKVQLSSGFVDSRPRRIDARTCARTCRSPTRSPPPRRRASACSARRSRAAPNI